MTVSSTFRRTHRSHGSLGPRRAAIIFLVLLSVLLCLPVNAVAAALSTMGHRTAHQNTATWTPIGPAPLNQNPVKLGAGSASGRVTAIAVNPTNSHEVWIGAADGGVWHSTTGGTSWTPQTDTQASLAIGSLAVDPNTPGTLYAGTGEANNNGDAIAGAGILKSTDNGQSWTLEDSAQFTGLSIGKIAVDPANSNIVGAAVSSNVQTTKAELANMGIWLSTNGGGAWTQVIKGAGTDILFNPQLPTTVFAAVANTKASPTIGGLYTSTSSGTAGTWKRVATGIPTGKTNALTRVALGIAPDGLSLSALFVSRNGITNNLFYVSTSSTPQKLGESWAGMDVSQTLGLDGRTPGLQQWEYDIFITYDPSDSTDKTIYVGGIHLWESTQGGLQFSTLLPNPPVHVDQHAMVFASPTSVYLGNDGGIWSGTNTSGQLTFTDLNTGGLSITQLYSGSVSTADPTNCGCPQLYGGSQDNGVEQFVPTQQQPSAWNEVVKGDGGAVLTDYTNRAVGYATLPGNTSDDGSATPIIVQSTKGGNGWNLITAGINPAEPEAYALPLAMSFVDNTLLFTGTNHVYSYTLVNGKMQWGAISGALGDGSALTAVAVAPTTNNSIYAGSLSGFLYATSTGGCSDNSCWSSAQPANSEVTSLTVDPVNPTIAYATYANYGSSGGGHVYKTTNGGQSWVDISATLPNLAVYSLAINPVDGTLLVGTNAGVYQGANDGSSWTAFGTGLPNVAVDQVFIDRYGTTLYAATHGRGMWTIPLPVSASWNPSPGMNPGFVNELEAASALSPTDIWAGGSYADLNGGQYGPGQTLLEQWNGSTWVQTTSQNPGAQGNGINSITGLPQTQEAWAAGEETIQSGVNEQPLVEQWNGGPSWTLMTVPTDGTNLNVLYGISASAANDIWAVGLGDNFRGTLMEHFDGTTWNVVTNAFYQNGTYTAVSDLDPKSVWFAGSDGLGDALVVHYDGTNWIPFITNPGQNAAFYGITAISSRDVWAVGLYTDSTGEILPLVEHYDGFTWNPIAVPPPTTTGPNYVYGVRAIPGTDQLWIAGTMQQTPGSSDVPFVMNYNGTNWTTTLLPAQGFGSSLFGIAATTENNVFVVGSSPIGLDGSVDTYIEQYSGSS